MKFFSSMIRWVVEWTQVLVAVGIVLAILALSSEVLSALSPVITFLVVLVLTIHACNRWTNAIIAILGIALYLASWLIMGEFGVCAGMLAWTSGVVLWLMTLVRSFHERSKKHKEHLCTWVH